MYILDMVEGVYGIRDKAYVSPENTLTIEVALGKGGGRSGGRGEGGEHSK